MNKLKWLLSLMCVVAMFAMTGCEVADGGKDNDGKELTPQEKAFFDSVTEKKIGKILVGGMGEQAIEFSKDGKTCTLTMLPTTLKIKVVSTFVSMHSDGKAVFVAKHADMNGKPTGQGKTYNGISITSNGVGHYYMPMMGTNANPKDKVFDGSLKGYPFDLMGGTPTLEQVIDVTE